MTKHLKIPRNADYFEFLLKVRSTFLSDFKKQDIKLPVIRSFDSAGEQLPFDPRLISLRQPNRNYGEEEKPVKGQISLVLDKCYYLPTGISADENITQK
jgi:hypothetical protein